MEIQKHSSVGVSCVLEAKGPELMLGNCIASVQSFDIKHASDIVEIRTCCKSLITPLSNSLSSLLVPIVTIICCFGIVCFVNLKKCSVEHGIDILVPFLLFYRFM